MFEYDLACFDIEKRRFDYSGIRAISESLMKIVMGKDALKKMRKYGPGIKGLRLMDVEFKSDGGAYIICERKYSEESTTMPLGNKNDVWSNYRFSCKDILITSVSNKGSIEWMNAIRKDQRFNGYDREYASFFGQMTSDDTILIYYNDQKENRSLANGQKVKPFRLSNFDKVLYQASIDSDGNIKKSIISNNSENYRISTSTRIQDGKDDSAVLVLTKGDKQHLARLQF